MTDISAFEKVTALFQDIQAAVVAANRCDLAYANATDPSYHRPFGLERPEAIAMNLAGVYAADTAANLIAALSGSGVVDSAAYVDALRRIATGILTVGQRLLVKNCANLAWRAGQPFRDIATAPLGRIGRSVNMQFMLLPEDEQDKDLVQVVEGAKILLETIEG